jgi:flagellin
MPLNVVSNYAANVAHRNLQATDIAASNSLAKLSIGKRVVSARDDAASMAIGSRMQSEVMGLKQAVINAGQANSMLQIADGAMSTLSDILTRMRVLAMQADSQNLGATERSFLDAEFQALKLEIDRVANDTEFNGTKLINADTTLTFKIGTGTVAAEDDLTFTISGVTAADLTVDGDDILNTTNTETALTNLSTAIDTLNTARAEIGARPEPAGLCDGQSADRDREFGGCAQHPARPRSRGRDDELHQQAGADAVGRGDARPGQSAAAEPAASAAVVTGSGGGAAPLPPCPGP